MSLAVVVTLQVTPAQLAALGSPGGPINRHWLQLMADIDATAKRKLSNVRVKVRTGNLRSSQQMPVVTVRGGRILGIAENTASYARAVHDGTAPHDILPRRGRFLTGWTYQGAPVFTPRVHHPGTQGRPWLTESVHEVLARA